MPTTHHKIEKNQLFPVDRRGDTMIVSPKGDPGSFSSLNFNLEHAALLAELRAGRCVNLLVDLSGSNYFGAKVVGAIAEWANVVAANAGRVAVCGVSDDMRELLHIYEFENQWQQFPTREAGVKALVKETTLQSFRRQWKEGVVLACCLVIGGLGFLYWQQNSGKISNERDYQTILAIWEEMQAQKNANAPPPEWRKLEGRAERELEPMVRRLKGRAGSRSEQAKAAQWMLFATRDHILKHILVQRNRLDLHVPTDQANELHWKMTALYLEKAHRIMNGQDSSDLIFPELPAEIVPVDGGQTDPDVPPDVPLEP